MSTSNEQQDVQQIEQMHVQHLQQQQMQQGSMLQSWMVPQAVFKYNDSNNSSSSRQQLLLAHLMHQKMVKMRMRMQQEMRMRQQMRMRVQMQMQLMQQHAMSQSGVVREPSAAVLHFHSSTSNTSTRSQKRRLRLEAQGKERKESKRRVETHAAPLAAEQGKESNPAISASSVTESDNGGPSSTDKGKGCHEHDSDPRSENSSNRGTGSCTSELGVSVNAKSGATLTFLEDCKPFSLSVKDMTAGAKGALAEFDDKQQQHQQEEQRTALATTKALAQAVAKMRERPDIVTKPGIVLEAHTGLCFRTLDKHGRRLPMRKQLCGVAGCYSCIQGPRSMSPVA